MAFGLCPAGTEFYDFTKTSFELHRVCTFKKYGSQCLARFLRLFLILTTVVCYTPDGLIWLNLYEIRWIGKTATWVFKSKLTKALVPVPR